MITSVFFYCNTARRVDGKVVTSSSSPSTRGELVNNGEPDGCGLDVASYDLLKDEEDCGVLVWSHAQLWTITWFSS